MSDFNFLIDTNIVIALEDAHTVDESFSELVRICNEHGIGLFVEDANFNDVYRDKDISRRAITLSKLPKFQQLRKVPIPTETELIRRFGYIKNDNDLSDVKLLNTLDANAVHFLITQDVKLYKRAERSNLGPNVMTVEEALDWLRQTFQEKTVQLPYVVERKAYEIELNNNIFKSLRADYPAFDDWFTKCRKQQRDCWVLEIDEQIAGLIIRNDENHSDAQTTHAGPKILKICTFKVLDEYRGEKFGELLLKQVLWFAQHNNYDLVYLTVFPKHDFLIDLLSYFGFSTTRKNQNGERVMEKPILKGTFPAINEEILKLDLKYYPRFYDGQEVQKLCVPIQPHYHQKLFPEIAFGTELPLFPNDKSLIEPWAERTPGNTIRKVYLCRANIQHLNPGDLLFFYMSKGTGYERSQTITTIGVIEQTAYATSTEELVHLTAKRSVFFQQELEALKASKSSPILIIDFLLVGHLEPPIPLNTLLNAGVFINRPPQSITNITYNRYDALRLYIEIGFKI